MTRAATRAAIYVAVLAVTAALASATAPWAVAPLVLWLAAALTFRETRSERTIEALQEDLDAAREAQAEAGRVKTDFLANMSHEIRTPMTAILGYAELLLDNRRDVDRVECVQTIRRNSHHLLQLIDDILDLTKIEAGTLEVKPVRADPGNVLAEVMSLMGVRATEKRLQLSAVYATDIPAAITTDPARLRQILLTVVGNAIKFTDRGSVRIVARCDFDAGVLEFEVADTGIGMAPEVVGGLFRPFTQADSSMTRLRGGSGLGLAVARPLAVALGGDITATSQPGRGSQLVVTVKTGDLAGVARHTDPTTRAAPAEWTAREVRARALLAEDGPDNQRLVSALLRLAGASVDVVDNGQDAVDRALAAEARGEPYHVVLMDMQMPVLDGYGATSLLRERGYARPIVALTAHAMRGDRERCLNAGCDDHVAKPIDRGALLDTLARWSGLGAAPPAVEPLRSSYADDPDMAELCAEFAAALPGVVAQIEAAQARGDGEGVRRLAHQLKGAGGSYGFQAVTEAAGALEAAAKERAPLDEHVRALRGLASRISAAAA